MRRILTAALASSLLALAIPAAASAHHGSRHDAARQARHHHRRHHRAHTVVFAPKVAPSGTTTGTQPPTQTSEAVATIASFEGGVLKLTLPDGSTASGKVTEMTEIECGGDHQGVEGQAPGFQHDDGQGDFGDDNGGDGGPGPSHHDDEQMPQGETSCGTASLVPGAKVQEAELNISSAGAIWEKVELFQQS
jgi:hypothetical protein